MDVQKEFDRAWWLRLPSLVPVEQVLPNAVAIGTACRIWAVEAAARLDRLCRWAAIPGDGAGG